MASTAWELALDLFFESWRISDQWGPAQSVSFRRRALNLSRLIGVAALSSTPVVIEIHLSSARQDLISLEAELARAITSYGQPARLPEWVEWSTRLAGQLSKWRQEVISAKDENMTQNEPHFAS